MVDPKLQAPIVSVRATSCRLLVLEAGGSGFDSRDEKQMNVVDRLEASQKTERSDDERPLGAELQVLSVICFWHHKSMASGVLRRDRFLWHYGNMVGGVCKTCRHVRRAGPYMFE